MHYINPITIAKQCTCQNQTDIEKFEKLGEILSMYKDEPGSLINSLYVAQTIFGYLPDKVIKFVASRLNEPVIKVFGVATFYSYFSRFPRGKYTIKVCLGTACYVRGGKTLLEKVKKELGISIGETTPDGLYTLEIVRCVGACALAPVVVVNNDTHRRVKSNQIPEILQSYISEVSNEN
ncbi:MAG: hypothetical protein A2015_11080 [Spirochaetes bacterium GWF1_31_7]|nr:MAG: hypothetical protein A2Y30_02315 [Spirochaetes bacterium GWE1_32_154]OHD46367.1 MAG: hypothetical protein A2Y29_04175 [Spirochaetes bacterium GWE2_31_10]OHD47746.1 MAG: hypothetical protein A2015_11080 [Spirochaetes bacterium GWF1_31_7]OHD81328.1 MAG: hypothetical protein A2355_10885 [Spirochaetes bacterium RIFOXYB1_FULL_32_8]HBD95594.1 NAD(P)H-dependent oxidoreductase subunit E [Spirochaetia bacterium]